MCTSGENNNFNTAREAQSIFVNYLTPLERNRIIVITVYLVNKGHYSLSLSGATCALHNIFASKQGKTMQCRGREYLVTCH